MAMKVLLFNEITFVLDLQGEGEEEIEGLEDIAGEIGQIGEAANQNELELGDDDFGDLDDVDLDGDFDNGFDDLDDDDFDF